MNFAFDVEEVNRDGFIAWDAVDVQSGDRVELKGPNMVVGAYPEIANHLAGSCNLAPGLVYEPRLGDKFDQSTQTWTFKRKGHEVVVKDMPRAIFRLTISS
jgi:hypothetical protein